MFMPLIKMQYKNFCGSLIFCIFEFYKVTNMIFLAVTVVC